MPDRSDLAATLRGLDRQGYGSYKRLRGSHDLAGMRLIVDRVQADPYAPPSLMRLVLDPASVALPPELVDDREGRIATADFLTRRFAEAADRATGGSGALSIGAPGQEVLERTSVLLAPDRIEARLRVRLPAAGRRIRGHEAARLITEVLPQVARDCLRHASLDAEALREHVTLLRDQEQVRSRLAGEGLVAFVGDGAILPRRFGDSDLPLPTGEATAFASPASLRVAFELPSGRTVSGMGVPAGVTVIVGGGYHGKSTLLRALERGVYPHLAGDGREWVITRADSATIRAEDGRAVTGTDISPFIAGLPSGADTARFSTTNASGSTSQAANLSEALAAGARALLIDEDTSATNFMIRDERMRELIPASREPITPFVDRVRPLHAELGVSTVLVAGGSGAFFDVADRVLALDAYRVEDVTERALRLAGRTGGENAGTAVDGRGDVAPGDSADRAAHAEGDRVRSDGADRSSGEPARRELWEVPPAPRIPAADGLGPGGRAKPSSARGRGAIRHGQETLDLSALPQLVDAAQTDALACALDRLADMADGRMSLPELVAALDRRIEDDGLDAVSAHRGHPGLLARPRQHEVHAMASRLRSLVLEGG